MKKLLLRSPAKINLFLKIINKRPDGYHNLTTLFERISLWDDIELKANSNGRIKIICEDPHVPLGGKNLCFKAAQLLKKEFRISEGLDIRIKKRIPVAAGLGGGSSNAATVLLGLNKYWGLHLSFKRLNGFAEALGSDVSFFLYNCSFALGKGKGEKIEKLNIKTRLWHILIVPKLKIYTQEVFEGLKLELTKSKVNVNIFIHYLKNSNIYNLRALLFNDLERRIVDLYPQLLSLKQKLQNLNELGVSFSGSGPSLFGLTESREEAEKLKRKLEKRSQQVFVVSTL